MYNICTIYGENSDASAFKKERDTYVSKVTSSMDEVFGAYNKAIDKVFEGLALPNRLSLMNWLIKNLIEESNFVNIDILI